MKLPTQPDKYDRYMEQQRSGILEREMQRISAALGVTGESVVTDHGMLTGLADNDHPQYSLTDHNHYPQTAAEIAAGVTPSDLSSPPGNVLRYGAVGGGADDTVAIQAALDSGGCAYIPTGTWTIAGTIAMPGGGCLFGDGPAKSTLSYTGAGKGIISKTLAVRTYGWQLKGFRLLDAGTGTTGVEMDSVSLAVVENVWVNGFDVGIDIYSPTSGFSVYNRFRDCSVACATGYRMRGTSSNANTFFGCRTNLATVRGVDISDSNENHFVSCQFESGGAGTAVHVSASIPGISPCNQFIGCRVEGYATGTGYSIGTDVSDTRIIAPIFLGTGPATPIADSGTRTQVIMPNGDTAGSQQISALSAARGSPWIFERTTSGGSEVPCMVIRDSATGGGTPVTLQAETERITGHFFRGVRGGTTYFEVRADGALRAKELQLGSLSFPSSLSFQPTMNSSYLYSTTDGAVLSYGAFVQDGTNNPRIQMYVDEGNLRTGIDWSFTTGNPVFAISRAGVDKLTLASNSATFADETILPSARIGTSTGPRIVNGTGTPEAVVAAPVGSLYVRTDGGAATTLYVKEEGAGNTGWQRVGSRGVVQTFASADATPSVLNEEVFKTAGTTAITDFDGGVVGQTIRILATDTITITNGAPIKLSGAVDFVMTDTDTLTLTMFDDQVWQEVARSVN